MTKRELLSQAHKALKNKIGDRKDDYCFISKVNDMFSGIFYQIETVNLRKKHDLKWDNDCGCEYPVQI